MTTDPAIIEAAARALQDCHLDTVLPVHHIASIVLAAVTPLIEANALEKAAVALKEAELQIEYLHERFGRTGSGEAVLARIRAQEETTKAMDRDDWSTWEEVVAAVTRALKEQP